MTSLTEKKCCEKCEGFESKGEDSWTYCTTAHCPCHTPSLTEQFTKDFYAVHGATKDPEELLTLCLKYIERAREEERERMFERAKSFLVEKYDTPIKKSATSLYEKHIRAQIARDILGLIQHKQV